MASMHLHVPQRGSQLVRRGTPVSAALRKRRDRLPEGRHNVSRSDASAREFLRQPRHGHEPIVLNDYVVVLNPQVEDNTVNAPRTIPADVKKQVARLRRVVQHLRLDAPVARCLGVRADHPLNGVKIGRRFHIAAS